MEAKMRAYGTIPGKLTVRFIETVKGVGVYPDGGGLYLQVTSEGQAKSWLFRYSRSRFGGRGDRNMGLGSLRDYDLAEARERARQCRVMLNDSIDPIDDRKAKRGAARGEAAKRSTFEDCAEDWINHNASSWDAATLRQVKHRLSKFVLPTFGKLPVKAIDVDLVYNLTQQLVRKRRRGARPQSPKKDESLQPFWEAMPPTARRVLGFIEGILHRAKVKEFRDGDNPASLLDKRGQKTKLGELLKDYDSVHTTEPLRPLPYRDVTAFLVQVRAHRNSLCGKAPTSGQRRQHEERPTVSYATEFQVLTATRPGQVQDAQWDEFEDGIWTCHNHKTRKKVKTPYIVPINKQARKILDVMRTRQRKAGFANSKYVFVHTNDLHYGTAYPGKKLGEKSIVGFIRYNLGRTDFDPHACRKTMSTWANDTDKFSHETIEMALGHKVGNEVAKKYNLATRIKPMQLLFDAWGEYCEHGPLINAKRPALRVVSS